MKKIQDYEIIDHGIENSSYFQGCGTSLTKFDECTTGIGETFNEALEDALEQLAYAFDYDLESVDWKKEKVDEKRNKECSVSAYMDEQEIPEKDRENCELYYYVSIRVK